MPMVSVMVLFALVAVHDALAPGGGARPAPDGPAWAWLLAGPLAPAPVLALAHARLAMLGRRIDRTGSRGAVSAARRVLGAARSGIVLVFAGLLAMGQLEAVRTIAGDVVLLDETLVLVWPILAIIALWWSDYPIERRVREASLLAALDSGGETPGLPTRGAFVWERARHLVLPFVVPIGLFAGWFEAVAWLTGRLGVARGGGAEAALVGGLALGGSAVIVAIMPAALRRLWSTTPIGAGALRDRLLGLCARSRVRVRDVLVWRTHFSMVNGALIGFVPGLRYILLTDALLARLSDAELEAVMAHEIAHARRGHLPWLLASVLSAAVLAGAAADGLLLLAGRWLGSTPIDAVWVLVSGGATGAAAVFVFGWVSRRFERQADAFAARLLSEVSDEREASESPAEVEGAGGPRTGFVRASAAGAMARALVAVCRLNNADPEKFSFRHGSIARRVRNLHATIGMPLDALPVDRTVRRIKLAAALAVLAAAGLIVWQAWASASASAGGGVV